MTNPSFGYPGQAVIASVDEQLLQAKLPTYTDLVISLRQILSELQDAREESTGKIAPVQVRCENIAKNMLRAVHKL